MQLPYLYQMILVTGGTGMVGMHLLLALTREEKLVSATYRSQDKVDAVKDFFAFAKAESQFSRIKWIQADITDVPSLQEAFQGIKVVYHCAALISFNPYDFSKLKKANIEGTANVVNLCLSHKVQKLCYLSSIATLAKTPNNPVTEENHWNPDAENSVYAITKYGAEMEVWRGTQEGLAAVILNPGVILGEGNYDTGSGAIFKRVHDGLNFYTAGGTGFIDVKDVINTMIAAMQKPILNKRYIMVSYNITYKKLVQNIAQALQVKPPQRKIPLLLLQAGRFLDMLTGWFTKNRKLTKVAVTSLQEISKFDNSHCLEDFRVDPVPLEDSLNRIAQHFLYLKGIKRT